MTPVWASSGHPLNGPLGDFVSTRIYGQPGRFKDFTALGVADSAQIVGAAVFYDYDREAGVIQCSGASDSARWLPRHILWEIFNYAFNEIACQALVMRVDPADSRLARILTAYGYEKHILPRLRGRDKDEAVYILFDDVWKKNRFHRQNRSNVLPVNAVADVGDIATA